MTNKLTPEEIIKALECCINDDCDNCPDTFGNCEHNAMRNALNLINRQQSEFEKLSVELVGMRGACNSYKMHYDNAQAEIERLQIRLRKERHQFEDLGKMYSEIRAEAIKEFLAKLQCEAFLPLGTWFSERVITESQAVAIAKEMVGEQG